jgi:hypothetical protein
MTLVINEHKSSSYAPRTYHNASMGVTLAVAVDFNTAGEKLTHKASTKGIVQVPFTTDYVQAARELYKLLKKTNCHCVNVAGNGIYTLKKYGVSQHDMNVYIYSILSLIHEHWPLSLIVSGGQSGADTAGLVAAEALGINCQGLWPKGYKMRFEDGKDVEMDKTQIEYMIAAEVTVLKKTLGEIK